MFKFFYMKFLMRFSFLFAFLAFLGVFVYAYVKDLTLKSVGEEAPFAETLLSEGQNTILPEQRALPLEKPHRTNNELQTWSSMVASEALSINKQEFGKVMNDIRPYFTQSGFRQYQEYLQSTGILQSINDNNYQMNVFVEEQPLLMNGSSMQGVYRWLYQLPITISFIPEGMAGALVNTDRIVNRKINLRIQIRRIKTNTDPNALAIESWSATTRR